VHGHYVRTRDTLHIAQHLRETTVLGQRWVILRTQGKYWDSFPVTKHSPYSVILAGIILSWYSPPQVFWVYYSYLATWK